MSLKPPKKSDLDKSWIKPRRDSHKKIQPEYHLIITEGTDTEPAYFGVMKEIINSAYSDRIQLSVLGAGDNTLSLFQKVYARFCGMVPPALTFIAERKAQSRIGTFICFHQYTNDCLKLVVYSTLLFLYYQSVLYIVVQNYSASY